MWLALRLIVLFCASAAVLACRATEAGPMLLGTPVGSLCSEVGWVEESVPPCGDAGLPATARAVLSSLAADLERRRDEAGLDCRRLLVAALLGANFESVESLPDLDACRPQRDAFQLKASMSEVPLTAVEVLDAVERRLTRHPQTTDLLSSARAAAQLGLPAHARLRYQQFRGRVSPAWQELALTEEAALAVPRPVPGRAQLDRWLASRPSGVDVVFLQPLREYALDGLLVSLAAASAEPEDRTKLAVVAELLASRGETSVSVIARQMASSSSSDRAGLVESLERYRGARALFDQGRYAAAAVEFDRLAGRLRLGPSGGEPLTSWASLWHAGSLLLANRIGDALAIYDDLLERGPNRPDHLLSGMVHWQRGVANARAGRFEQAARDHLRSVTDLEQTGEVESTAAARSLVAESFRLAGNETEAWAFRFEALRALQWIQPSRRRHVALREAGLAAQDRNLDAAAALFWGAAAEDSDPSDHRALYVDTQLLRFELLRRLDSDSAAAAALAEAELSLPFVQGEVDGERSRVAVRLSKALANWCASDSAQREGFDEALSYFSRQGLEIELGSTLARGAEAARRCGDAAEARRNLERALSLLEIQAPRFRDGKFAVAFQSLADRVAEDFMDVDGRDTRAVFDVAGRARRLLRPATRCKASAGPPTEDPNGPSQATLVVVSGPARLYFRWVVAGVAGETSRESPRAELLLRLQRLELEMSGDGAEEAVRAFSTWFLADVPDAVFAAGRLVVVPSGPLNRVPWAALVRASDGRFLAESQEIRLALDDSVEFQVQTEPAPEKFRLLVVANARPSSVLFPRLSPLPALSASSVESWRKRHAVVLNDGNATRRALLREIGSADEVYFLGHSTVHGRFGPALLLAPEASDVGLVTTEDILSLGCQARRRVVLSACDTTQGRHASGAGSLGLAGAFVAIGAAEVVATVGAVSDEAGTEVAERIRDCSRGRRLADCLRAVQKDLMTSSSPTLSSPAAWGRFVVVSAG